jgi:uncharacterized protein YbaP (TraB family)
MRTPNPARRIALAFFCALISISACAQSSAYKPGAPVMMWKISSPNNSAYLLGSVHLGDKSLYPLPPVIENAFAASSLLIVEVGSRNVAQMQSQVQQLIAEKGTYPLGDDLYNHITPETRAKLDAFLNHYGYPSLLIASFRPWMAALTVSMLPLIKAGLNPNEGIDLYFMKKAGVKRIEQLEDPAWQINLLADVSERTSDKLLISAIAQAEHSTETWTKLATFWTEGAGDKIDELTKTQDAADTTDEKVLSRRLREDRNPHMTDRLEKCLQSSESCFMIVGAAHAVGSEGIVKQLQARGYRVEQAVVQNPASVTPVSK